MADRLWYSRTLNPYAVVLVLATAGCSSGGPAVDRSAGVEPIAAPAAAPAGPAAPAPMTKPARRKPPAPRPSIRWADSTVLERAVMARLGHRPLAAVLARRTRRPDVADRAALAVAREGRRLNMSPSLLVAVLLIENRALDTAAVSSQGAVGLMQVMPIHAGSYGCPNRELRELDTNICHGARLLRLYVVRSPSLRVALRRYNGCVRGTVTPRCSRYPVRVLATAASVRRELLALAAEDAIIVPSVASRGVAD
jgi:soluble lytic murein transglycosylase-like protein